MNGSEREGVSSVSKRVIGAAITGWLFLILTVAVSALVFYMFTLPMEIAPWVVGTLTYLAAFLTGFLSAKRALKKGFVNGFWGGVLFVAVYFAVNLIAGNALRLLNGLVLLILSMIGGIFGINAKKTQRRR
ncbi:MAG: TIGR04086 family membrane protein [Clostridia bacterium]|nr:TIGR04086 family membrane protein [Clostridia bacterium]